MKETAQPCAARPPLEERTVAEIMTLDLLTIDATESVLMAWELMHQARCHHLPVVSDNGHCLGILDAKTVAATWEAGGPERNRKPVTDLLTGCRCDAVRPDDRLGTAAEAMMLREADHIAVTDAGGRLVGLLTATDIVAAVAGADRQGTADRTGMPSLYRIEPVLPEEHRRLRRPTTPGRRDTITG